MVEMPSLNLSCPESLRAGLQHALAAAAAALVLAT